jgi:F-type H+-transporting ATPase subunit a
MALKLLLPATEDSINISGAYVWLEIPFPIQNLVIGEAQINSWAVILTILGLCLYLTHGISEKGGLKRQMIAEWIVEKVKGIVHENMDSRYAGYAPYISAILALSALSSLISLLGLYSPTTDLSVVGGWALLTFLLITWNKLKGGILNYLKSYTEPIPLLTPINIISEFATPVSMTLRHFGNILSGSVISVLLAYALTGLSTLLFGKIPLIGGLAEQFPLFRIGIPAVLSLYFDLFSGCLQAYIFAMLTMINVNGAYPEEAVARLQARRQKRAEKKAAAQVAHES